MSREDITWPGSADGVRESIDRLHHRWREVLDQLSDQDLRSNHRTRWPFQDRPFGDVVAWVNIELTKNASEIGYARFLYAQRTVSERATPAGVHDDPPLLAHWRPMLDSLDNFGDDFMETRDQSTPTPRDRPSP